LRFVPELLEHAAAGAVLQHPNRAVRALLDLTDAAAEPDRRNFAGTA
jgi:hypothetical protein